jgi:two-component system chemotaxis response regulator CheY
MPKVIMTVDDSISIRQMVSFTLKREGYEVVEAVDGIDAMKKLNSENPVHMMVTDLNMPNMDGIELIKNVRTKPNYKFMPIIMLTTESQEERKQAGKAAGATGWIVKPFKPDQLLGVIKKVLK